MPSVSLDPAGLLLGSLSYASWHMYKTPRGLFFFFFSLQHYVVGKQIGDNLDIPKRGIS